MDLIWWMLQVYTNANGKPNVAMCCILVNISVLCGGDGGDGGTRWKMFGVLWNISSNYLKRK